MALTNSGMGKHELNEEIEFFRDYCGWSDDHIEEHLGLAHGTMAQRRQREARKPQRAA